MSSGPRVPPASWTSWIAWLDKGIVIDAWVRVSLVGIELVTVEARVVVASIATYLGYSDALSDLRQTAAPQPGYPVSAVGKSFPTWSPIHVEPPSRWAGARAAS